MFFKAIHNTYKDEFYTYIISGEGYFDAYLVLARLEQNENVLNYYSLTEYDIQPGDTYWYLSSGMLHTEKYR